MILQPTPLSLVLLLHVRRARSWRRARRCRRRSSSSLVSRCHLPRWDRCAPSRHTRTVWGARPATSHRSRRLSTLAIADRGRFWASLRRRRSRGGRAIGLRGGRGRGSVGSGSSSTRGRANAEGRRRRRGGGHALTHQLLQALELGVELNEAGVGALLLAIDGLGDKVLEGADLFGGAAGFVVAAAGGGFKFADGGFDVCEGGIEASGALLLGGFEGVGVFGELVEEGEGLLEGGVDRGLVLLELRRGWGGNQRDDVALRLLMAYSVWGRWGGDLP